MYKRQSVAEEDRGGAVALGDGVQRGVAGVAGGGLGAARPAAVDPHGLDGIEVEGRETAHDLGGTEVGARLEAVVDGDPAGPDPEAGGLEGEGGGEGHGVGTAGARDEHERRLAGGGGGGGRSQGEDVVENAADRQAYRRDRGVWTHVRMSNRSIRRGVPEPVPSRRCRRFRAVTEVVPSRCVRRW